jgi:hypothetical protein
MADGSKTPGKSVAQSDLEAVIRRAVELATVQVDAEDRVSEAELIRIGNEIGLPAEKVRQALYEQPQLEADPHWYTPYFDSPIVTSSRILPGKADATLVRVEEYISAREYMQLVRRKSGELRFIPAEDAISRLARGLSRPGKRYHLAHARRVVVNVQQISDTQTHIRLDSDFSEQRAASVKSGMWGGALFGVLPGAIAASFIMDPLHGPVAAFAMIATVGAAMSGGAVIGVKVAANSFREHLAEARREIEGLLDRAEHSDRLEPPPAPWRRSLRAKLFGR